MGEVHLYPIEACLREPPGRRSELLRHFAKLFLRGLVDVERFFPCFESAVRQLTIEQRAIVIGRVSHNLCPGDETIIAHQRLVKGRLITFAHPEMPRYDQPDIIPRKLLVQILLLLRQHSVRI